MATGRTHLPDSACCWPKGARRRWRNFAGCVICMAVVWLVLLPAAGRRDALRRAIDSRERRGIDASAMFYTELEVMDDVLERSREFHRRSPEALWRCQW